MKDLAVNTYTEFPTAGGTVIYSLCMCAVKNIIKTTEKETVYNLTLNRRLGQTESSQLQLGFHTLALLKR